MRLRYFVALMAFPACFYPTFERRPCPDGQCPDGWTCNLATKFCELADAGPHFDALDVDTSIDTPVDAPIGALPDGPPPDARQCFGTATFEVCLISPPANTLTIPTTTIDTASSPSCAAVASGGNYCVLAAEAISVTGTLRAVGPRPLVLLASNSISTTATGIIDVGTHLRESVLGAGADPDSCVDGRLPTTASSTSGGGAGGSFLGQGGAGGAGGADAGNAGGAGGQAGGTVSASSLTELRGGCSGQAGRGPSDSRGIPGHGGGAVLLIAAQQISVAGAIKAGGSGGGFGGTGGLAGGGGGGAGGMIVLDAPVIINTGLLQANGGAGGQGCGVSSDGTHGEDADGVAAAAGGTDGAIEGGNGGNGAAGAATSPGTNGGPGTSGTSISDRGGGGGGGGGAGIIVAPANASLGTNVSPAPTALP